MNMRGKVIRVEPRVKVSPAEAAWLAGVTRKTVDQAIDREEIRPVAVEGRSPRALGVGSIVYLRVRRDAGELLSSEAKRQLSRELEAAENGEIPAAVELGPIRIDTKAAAEEVVERLAQYAAARKFVVVDPEIRGGEPVIAGTRVPVYMLAEMVRVGDPREEILKHYPSVSAEALDAALLWTQVNRRRGRPAPPPWESWTPKMVFTREELEQRKAARRQ
jgi:uncharacterized protein (DUF433 family)